jgi:hypothetical protein
MQSSLIKAVGRSFILLATGCISTGATSSNTHKSCFLTVQHANLQVAMHPSVVALWNLCGVQGLNCCRDAVINVACRVTKAPLGLRDCNALRSKWNCEPSIGHGLHDIITGVAHNLAKLHSFMGGRFCVHWCAGVHACMSLVLNACNRTISNQVCCAYLCTHSGVLAS